jgi:hypothetical protein
MPRPADPVDSAPRLWVTLGRRGVHVVCQDLECLDHFLQANCGERGHSQRNSHTIGTRRATLPPNARHEPCAFALRLHALVRWFRSNAAEQSTGAARD